MEKDNKYEIESDDEIRNGIVIDYCIDECIDYLKSVEDSLKQCLDKIKSLNKHIKVEMGIKILKDYNRNDSKYENFTKLIPCKKNYMDENVKTFLKKVLRIIDDENKKWQDYKVKMKGYINEIDMNMYNNLSILLDKTKYTICTSYSENDFVCLKIGGKYLSSNNELSMGYPVLKMTPTYIQLLMSLGIVWNEINNTFMLNHMEIGKVENGKKCINIKSTIIFYDNSTYTKEGSLPYNSTMSLRDIIPLYSQNDIDVKMHSSVIHVTVDALNSTFCVQVDNCPQLIYSGCDKFVTSMFTGWMTNTFDNINNHIKSLGDETFFGKVGQLDDEYFKSTKIKNNECVHIEPLVQIGHEYFKSTKIKNNECVHIEPLVQNTNIKRLLSMDVENDDSLLNILISFLREENTLLSLPEEQNGESKKLKKLERIIDTIIHDAESNEIDVKETEEVVDKDDLKESNNEEEIIAFANRLSNKINHAGIMNPVPSFTTEIEKCETIRDFSILKWGYPLNEDDGINSAHGTKEKSDRDTDNTNRKMKKNKTFSLLKEVRKLGGYTRNLKPLFKDIHTMANNSELVEIDNYYEKYIETIEKFYVNTFYISKMSDNISWEKGLSIRRKIRLFMIASLILSQYPLVNRILNRELKNYFNYILRYTLYVLINNIKDRYDTKINGWVNRALVNHLSNYENMIEFVCILKIWMCEFQFHPIGKYWLDGISTMNGSLEKDATGKYSALFTPITKHMRVIKLRKDNFCKVNSKDGIYQHLSAINNPILLINLSTGEGILSLESIRAKNNDDMDNIIYNNLGDSNIIKAKHIFRPIKQIKIKEHHLEPTDTGTRSFDFNLDFVDIFLNRKHWMEIIKNKGLFNLVAVGKHVKLSKNKKMDKKSSLNEKEKDRYTAIHVMSSLYDEYGETISHVPKDMIQDMKNVLGDEGYKRALQSLAPVKIKLLICDGDDDNIKLSIDANHCYKKCDLTFSSYPIQYASSMFIPRYRAGVIKYSSTSPSHKKADDKLNISLKKYQISCNGILQKINNINKYMVKLECKRLSLTSKIYQNSRGLKRKLE
nr:MAG: hypothetical protein [Marsupenaeus japonicus endogenous nimavirus]